MTDTLQNDEDDLDLMLGSDPLEGLEDFEGIGRSQSILSKLLDNKNFKLAVIVLLGTILVLVAIGLAFEVVVGVMTGLNPETTQVIITDGTVVQQDKHNYWKNLSSTVHEALDKSVNPCDDFYQYACGGWIKKAVIPPDKVEVEKSFSYVDDMNQIILNSIMTAKWPMITTLYDNCMDQERRNLLGGTPLIPYLELISGLNEENIMTVIGTLHQHGIVPLFSFDVSPDLLNPTFNRFELDQGGFGLPSRDYYFSNDTIKAEAREAYMTRIISTLELLSELDVDFTGNTQISDLSFRQQAENIFAFETALATGAMSPVQRRNITALYNLYTINEFVKEVCPTLNWEHYFAMIELPVNVTDVNVVAPRFYTNLNTLIPSTSIDLLQNYLRWYLTKSTSTFLSASYYNVTFQYLHTVNGYDEPPPLQKQCTSSVNNQLGMLVGRYFISEAWSEASQAIASGILSTIKEAFHQDLLTINWMDEETREAALGKLAAVNDKIGHPVEWPDYSKLYIIPGAYFNNTLESYSFEIRDMMETAGKPVDKGKWDMTPQTVNAYYDPQLNEMVFPAAILQEPFFSELYPSPMNYGGIGAVMGHELTHGFDDQGSEFNATGSYVEWWTPQSVQNFDEKTECVANLYDGFQIPSGAYLNGEQTLGENIADMGGVKDAYVAMRKSLEKNKEEDDISKYFDMTADELYFVSYGQLWCAVILPEHEDYLLSVDVHSPPKARVNYPLSQFPQFAETFKCAADSPMNPVEKCTVW